jgi:hypothetical protein
MVGGMRSFRVAPLALAVLLGGCGGSSPTAMPEGHPLNPCPVAGPGAIVPREGYSLVPPGTIVVGYDAWHNETPATFACGAQSVTGGTKTVRPADFESGFVPWVATYHRAVPITAREAIRPTVRVFRVDGATPALVETTGPQEGPDFGALGTMGADKPAGQYRMEIRSAGGSLLAETSFEIVD